MIQIREISHTYNSGNNQEILHDISLDIPEGQFCLLLGQSGSGKTTLLNIIAGLLKPTKGRVLYNDNSIYEFTEDRLCEFRHKKIGFIFQNYFLEDNFTVEENVLIPLLLDKDRNEDRNRELIVNALEQVGLSDKSRKKPKELSGGECQRVSIARALVTNPEIIIADEPTGNLDSVNGRNVIEILKKQAEKGKTVLMVTHNESYIPYADVVLRILDGAIV